MVMGQSTLNDAIPGFVGDWDLNFGMIQREFKRRSFPSFDVRGIKANGKVLEGTIELGLDHRECPQKGDEFRGMGCVLDKRWRMFEDRNHGGSNWGDAFNKICNEMREMALKLKLKPVAPPKPSKKPPAVKKDLLTKCARRETIGTKPFSMGRLETLEEFVLVETVTADDGCIGDLRELKLELRSGDLAGRKGRAVEGVILDSDRVIYRYATKHCERGCLHVKRQLRACAKEILLNKPCAGPCGEKAVLLAGWGVSTCAPCLVKQCPEEHRGFRPGALMQYLYRTFQPVAVEREVLFRGRALTVKLHMAVNNWVGIKAIVRDRIMKDTFFHVHKNALHIFMQLIMQDGDNEYCLLELIHSPPKMHRGVIDESEWARKTAFLDFKKKYFRLQDCFDRLTTGGFCGCVTDDLFDVNKICMKYGGRCWECVVRAKLTGS